MVALDFATLGAYELTAPEGDAALAQVAVPLMRRPARPRMPPHRGAHHRDRPKRVLLFAQAAPVCSEQDWLGRGPLRSRRRHVAARQAAAAGAGAAGWCARASSPVPGAERRRRRGRGGRGAPARPPAPSSIVGGWTFP